MKSIITGIAVLLVCTMGAGAVAQPDAISNLVFWVKADAGVTTNAGGKVTVWADGSGRGNHAAATASAEPDLIKSEPGLNGMPTLRFNGSSQYLSMAERILTNGVTAFTVIAMAKADINDNVALVAFRTGGGNPFVQLDQDTAGRARFIVRNAAGNVTANAVGGVHTGTYGMYAGRLTQSNATTWTNQIFFSKTVAEAAAAANFSSDPYLTSGAQYIGRVSTTPTCFWDGDIAEIMIYERALSTSEMSAIELYLTGRYKVNRIADSVPAVDEVPGLALWLRADAGVYEDPYANDSVENSETVVLWSDLSSAAHDAVGLDSPTWVPNTVNGLPAIGFSQGQGDRFYLRDSPITTDPDQMVVFAVFRPTAGISDQQMIFTHRNAATQLIQASIQNSTDAKLQIRGSGNVIRTITASGVLTNGEFTVVMYQFDVVNDRHAVAVNGNAEVVDTYDFGSQSFIADTQRIGYYALDGGSGLFFRGFMAELIVYEGVALSRDQKRGIGYYLEQKYALDTGYSPPGTVILVH